MFENGSGREQRHLVLAAAPTEKYSDADFLGHRLKYYKWTLVGAQWAVRGSE
jgi:hypothetical protein